MRELASLFVGVDPGASGAVAFLDARGDVADIVDCPTVTLNKRARVSAAGLVAVFHERLARGHHLTAALERVHAMPRRATGNHPQSGMGATSAFSFGQADGILEGVVAALGIPFVRVTPQLWKRTTMPGAPKGKDASRAVALALWPDAADLFRLKKHHNRADAALIARWLWLTSGAEAPV